MSTHAAPQPRSLGDLAALKERGELAGLKPPEGFQVRPRWPLDELDAA